MKPNQLKLYFLAALLLICVRVLTKYLFGSSPFSTSIFVLISCCLGFLYLYLSMDKKSTISSTSSSPSPPLRFHKTLEESREYVPLFRWQNKDRGDGSPPGSASRPFRRGNSGRVGPVDDYTALDTTSRTSTGNSDASSSAAGGGRVYIDVTGLEEYPVASRISRKAVDQVESMESEGFSFGITRDTLSETASEALQHAADLGGGILSMFGISSSDSTSIRNDRSMTPLQSHAPGFLTGVSKSTLYTSMTPVGLTQSSVKSSVTNKQTLRRRNGVGGEGKGEISTPIIPINSIAESTTSTVSSGTPPNVLLSSTGRRIYLGRSAERVARIKAQKAERTAKKTSMIATE